MSARLDRSKWFSQEEMAVIITEMQLKGTCRDAFLVKFAFLTGMRISEIMNLNVGDVQGKEFVDVRGKCEILRRIPFSTDLQASIANFIKYKIRRNEPVQPDSPLFMSNYHQRLSPSTVQKNIKRWAKLIGCPKLNNMHQFRHSLLTFVANKVGVTVARDLAGHSNVSVTSVYLHTDDAMLRNAVEMVRV